jgi:hypothetical protein
MFKDIFLGKMGLEEAFCGKNFLWTNNVICVNKLKISDDEGKLKKLKS